jgi:hypothetical protein
MGSDPDDFDVEAWNQRLLEPDPVVGVAAAETVAEEGFPAFAHNQWTVEGEIERFGAFGRGAARATGWKRAVALLLVALLLGPVLLGGVVNLLRLLG